MSADLSRRETSIYPDIAPVPAGVIRPFWSIMIPVYNCANYLRQTLASVLLQFALDETVQIEVIDDCSTRDDPAQVVAACGDPRVTYYRHPENVGPQANFTACIARARGEWVHILHGDDLVMPNFYATLRRAAESTPRIGAAFCRTINIDGEGVWIDLSEPEGKVAGVVFDLLARLAVCNVIMFPSIAVKRSTYEAVGGFHPALFHSADWDMWKRVALRVPVWYEPAALAMYRQHPQSDTSTLMRTGANIADARHAIAIAREYLPALERDDLTRRARLYHGKYALEIAGQMIERGSWSSAFAQVREALRCGQSLSILYGVTQVACRAAWRLVRSESERAKPGTSAVEGPSSAADDWARDDATFNQHASG
jgi:glycosyltransferase involved in cell wall biosynthesis